MSSMAPGARSGAPAHDAKRPLSPVAGPYGHPFHPILVTIPIGAWVCSFVLDLATRFDVGNKKSLMYGSLWLIAIGIIGALIAAVPGLLDLLTIPRQTTAFRTGLTHLTLNLTVVAIFVIAFVWRQDDHEEFRVVSAAKITFSAVGLAILAVSGWLGGRLAYRYGVRVADETTQAEGYAAIVAADDSTAANPG
jgi:uncharacterized membrane protein